MGCKLLIMMILMACESWAEERPPTILWAWESPQNLQFSMKTHPRVGVAFLARTVELRGEGVSVRPRMQPLRLGPETYLVAVVRVESRGASLSAEQRKRMATAIVDAARSKNVRELQIDYDVKRSERDFYGQVLREVRGQLPKMRITITALASWCLGDDWIGALPVDGAVPMLFRLGAENDLVRRTWESREKEALCRESVGLSTDEVALGTGVKQVYWFHPGSWDEESVEQVVNRKQP